MEVADIFREHWQEYCNTHTVSALQHKVAAAIMRCGTAALGGHLYQCNSCGYRKLAYNSCRNRHCPKCQGHKAYQWVEARKQELLPVEYFHSVFTLPQEFNELCLVNKRLIYKLMFQAVSKTLLQVGRNNLKCQLGFFAILHTWGSSMTLHPHLHIVIPGCGISIEGQKIVRFKKHYFVSDKILSKIFRGKFISLLKKAQNSGSLKTRINDLNAFLGSTLKNDWVVRTKPPFAGPQVVLKYLSRYIQRIAISNRRLLSLKNGTVEFSCKDYRFGITAPTKLPACEFIRRFLLHCLPQHFVRIRFYGFLARGQKKNKLSLLRTLLVVANVLEKTALNPHTISCPCCKNGSLKIIALFYSNYHYSHLQFSG